MKKTFPILIVLVLLLAACVPTPPTLVIITPAASGPLPSATPAPLAPTQAATPTSNSASAPSNTPASPPAPASTPGVIPATGQNGSVPNFDHIVLIVLENQSYSAALDPASMPKLAALAQKNVLLTNYYAVGHPSLPNYLALMSGSTQGVTTDCLTCFVTAPNLADEIQKSSRTWKAYLEGMPAPCTLGDVHQYAQKHNPFIYFTSIRTDIALCDSSIVPLTQLTTDLSANQLPNFAFIMPNLCNSGHSCPPSTADQWLSAMLTKLQAGSGLGKNSLIIVTFDEADSQDKTSSSGSANGGGKVVTILISPLAKPAFQDNTAYSHYSLLKTILAAWSLPDLGKTSDANVSSILAPWATSTP